MTYTYGTQAVSYLSTVVHQVCTDFLTLVTTSVPRNSILASIDVSSLHTNMPHADVIKASVDALKREMLHMVILIRKIYIDNIFMIWTITTAQLQMFMFMFMFIFMSNNTVHCTIKFTHEHDKNEPTFLNVTVYNGPRLDETGILDVKTHIKPTNYM